MIDVFRIGVSIGMTNDVSPVIGTIQRDLGGLEQTLDRTIARFGTLRSAAVGALGNLAPGLAGIVKAEFGGERRTGAASAGSASIAATMEAAARTLRDSMERGIVTTDVRARPGRTSEPILGLSPSFLIRHDTEPHVAGAPARNPGTTVDLAPLAGLMRRTMGNGAATPSGGATTTEWASAGRRDNGAGLWTTWPNPRDAGPHSGGLGGRILGGGGGPCSATIRMRSATIRMREMVATAER